jgi:hypothetical protein
MSENRETVPNWLRLFSWPIYCVGATGYVATLLNESRDTHESHLWRDLWKDAWLITNSSLGFVVCSAIFIGAFAVLWCSIPAFYCRSPALSKYKWLGCGVFAFGAIAAMTEMHDRFGEYYLFRGGESLVVFCVWLSFA